MMPSARTSGFSLVAYFPPGSPALQPGTTITARDRRGRLVASGLVQPEHHPRLVSVRGRNHQETAMERPPTDQLDQHDADNVEPALITRRPYLWGDQDRVVFFRDLAGKWRWRYRVAGNGAILGDSGQGYVILDSAWLAAERVTRRRIVEAHDPDGEAGTLPAVVWR